MAFFTKIRNFFSTDAKIKSKFVTNLQRDKDPNTVWSIVGEIGDGAFGKVYKAVRNDSGTEAALKQVEIKSEDDLVDFMVEVEILTECRHPNIVGLHETFLYENKLWMYVEFCGGGAVDSIMVDLEKPLTEPQIRCICRQMCQALDFLHKKYIIHRDLKAGNVLLTLDGVVKLADFGVSAKNSPSRSTRDSFVGTPYWMAPEVILCETLKDKPYNSMADIWSLGITLIEFAQMEPPNNRLHHLRVLFKIQKSEPPTFDDPELWSESFQNFLTKCLAKDPKSRLSAEELLRHPFICDVTDHRPIRELLSEAKADVTVEIKEVDDVQIKDDLRDGLLDGKSADIDLDKISVSHRSFSFGTADPGTPASEHHVTNFGQKSNDPSISASLESLTFENQPKQLPWSAGAIGSYSDHVSVGKMAATSRVNGKTFEVKEEGYNGGSYYYDEERRDVASSCASINISAPMVYSDDVILATIDDVINDVISSTNSVPSIAAVVLESITEVTEPVPDYPVPSRGTPMPSRHSSEDSNVAPKGKAGTTSTAGGIQLIRVVSLRDDDSSSSSAAVPRMPHVVPWTARSRSTISGSEWGSEAGSSRSESGYSVRSGNVVVLKGKSLDGMSAYKGKSSDGMAAYKGKSSNGVAVAKGKSLDGMIAKVGRNQASVGMPSSSRGNEMGRYSSRESLESQSPYSSRNDVSKTPLLLEGSSSSTLMKSSTASTAFTNNNGKVAPETNKRRKSHYTTLTKTRRYTVDGQEVTSQTSKTVITGEENKAREEYELW